MMLIVWAMWAMKVMKEIVANDDEEVSVGCHDHRCNHHCHSKELLSN